MSVCCQVSTSPLKSSKQVTPSDGMPETGTAANGSLFSPVVVTVAATGNRGTNPQQNWKGGEARESPVAVNLFCDESMPPQLASAQPLPIQTTTTTTTTIWSSPTNNAGCGKKTLTKPAKRYGRRRRRYGRGPPKASFAVDLVRYNNNHNNNKPLPLKDTKVTFSIERNTVREIPDRASFEPGEKYRRWYSLADMRGFRAAFRNYKLSQFLQQHRVIAATNHIVAETVSVRSEKERELILV